MQSIDGRLFRFSPTDLNAFLACEHLTTLQVAVARGELEKPFRHNPHADLIRRKGDEHEAAYLARLRAEGRDGHRDRLRRPRLGARRPRDRASHPRRSRRRLPGRPHRRHLARVRGLHRAPRRRRRLRGRRHQARPPRQAAARASALLLHRAARADPGARARRPCTSSRASGERESFRPDDFFAYYRRLRARFLDAVERRRPTYPYPVDFCGLCDFLALCKERWAEDDHLTLVAGVSRLQVERLQAAGHHDARRPSPRPTRTPRSRACARPPSSASTTRPGSSSTTAARASTTIEHLPEEPDRGFALLPEPSPGDVWLDLEGDPWFEPARGLEYLFGWVELGEDGAPRYEHVWARDRDAEKRGFERLVDHIVERRRRFPGMHVYHYAPYERTALSRLMGQHGTREEEIDDLLRGEVLVDLFRVTKQALRASVPSYSIKEVEKLFGFERTRRGRGRGRVGDRVRDVARDRRTTRSSTGSATTTRRTASRSTSCTSGCWSSARPARGGCRRTSASGARRPRSATPSGRASATRSSPARRRATPTGSSRTCSTTTSARSGRSGGSTSSTAGSTTRSSSRTGTRSAGSCPTASRTR